MGDISRKWEKRIAWITNIIMIFLAVMTSVIAFTGILSSAINTPLIKDMIDMSITQEAYQDPFWAIFISNTGFGADNAVGMVAFLAKVIAVVLVIATFLALIATFSIRKRVFSATLFLIVAVINLLGVAVWFMSIPYLLVALLLFFRK